MAELSQLELNGTTYDLKDKNARITISEHPCMNLVDNWYFIGGGSQRTDIYSALPINQRGQTSYTGLGGTIDMWRLSGNAVASFNVSLPSTNDCLRLDNTQSTGQNWIRTVKKINVKAGYTYTISCLVKSGTGRIAFLTSENTIAGEAIIFNGPGLYEQQITFTDNNELFFAVLVYAGASADIYAVKVELGNHQTLAHEEDNGSAGTKWVINEIPDYSIELMKCQRYFQLVPASSDFMMPLGYGLSMSSTEYRISVPLPTPMVHTPDITISNCALRFYQNGLANSKYISGYSAVTASTGNASTVQYRPYVLLRFTVSGAVAGESVIAVATGQSGSNKISGLLLSAEE